MDRKLGSPSIFCKEQIAETTDYMPTAMSAAMGTSVWLLEKYIAERIHQGMKAGSVAMEGGGQSQAINDLFITS